MKNIASRPVIFFFNIKNAYLLDSQNVTLSTLNYLLREFYIY